MQPSLLSLLRISAKELVYTLFYSKINYHAYSNPTGTTRQLLSFKFTMMVATAYANPRTHIKLSHKSTPNRHHSNDASSISRRTRYSPRPFQSPALWTLLVSILVLTTSTQTSNQAHPPQELIHPPLSGRPKPPWPPWAPWCPHIVQASPQ